MAKKKGLGRGLEGYEVALIKNMRHRGLSRDFIMSLILRPGRVLTPAAVSEVLKGRIGPDIDDASHEETDAFIQRRMTGAGPIRADDLGGPTSQTVVLEVLRTAKASDANYAALESRTLEFKEQVPVDKAGCCAIAKTIAAYANTGGGYIIFGVRDDREVIGIEHPENFPRVCGQIADTMTECFCPSVWWDKSVVEYQGHALGVVYTHRAATKPVIAMRDASDIYKSAIYFRYEGKSQRIEPGDLLQMLHERDRSVAAQATPPGPVDV